MVSQMRYGPSADAPTHLGSNQLGLPPEWLGDEGDGEIVTSAVRGGRGHAQPAAAAAPPSYSSRAASGSIYPRPAEPVEPAYRRVPTERSAGAAFPPEEAPYRRVKTEPGELPAELPSAPPVKKRESRREKTRDGKREP